MEEENGKKRRRVRTTRYNFDFMENEEQRLLQQALKISKRDTKRVEVEIPEAPTYYPNIEEFQDPIAYIKKIRPEAEPYGIIKIVPPSGWQFPCQVTLDDDFLFPTRAQRIDTLQQGQGYDDGKSYTLRDYKRMADHFKETWIEKHHKGKGIEEITNEELEKDYWNMVETSMTSAEVEYGNDLDTTKYKSGFPRVNSQEKEQETDETNPHRRDISHPEYYRHTGWNTNNIAKAPGSILQYIDAQINGVNVPWLYIGMLFATFCWHNEDNYLYSINYNHFGAAKRWYGVPGAYAGHFERVSKDFLSGLFREAPDLLHHMTTQISPSLLAANGVPICKLNHEAGSFVVTFPKSFHCGFSMGFNVGEAVNFACTDWLMSGREAEERYRTFAREPVFSHARLLFTLVHNQEKLSKNDRIQLGKEVIRLLNEELNARNAIIESGVKDLSEMIVLPPNDFSVITEKMIEYDDMRGCCVCKQVCTFTAVACECSKTKVSCTRHYTFMCKCPPEKKFLLAWESNDRLLELRNNATRWR